MVQIRASQYLPVRSYERSSTNDIHSSTIESFVALIVFIALSRPTTDL